MLSSSVGRQSLGEPTLLVHRELPSFGFCVILRGASLYEPTNIWPRPTTKTIRDLNARFSMQLGGISCRGSEPGLCGLCLPPIFQFRYEVAQIMFFVAFFLHLVMRWLADGFLFFICSEATPHCCRALLAARAAVSMSREWSPCRGNVVEPDRQVSSRLSAAWRWSPRFWFLQDLRLEL